jgi:hypothetical protein
MRYIIIGSHDATAEPCHVKCLDSYNEAFLAAGKWWKAQDLAFDPKREDPFYVEPDTYDEDVYIHRVKKQIRFVQHSNGDGPTLWILPESR